MCANDWETIIVQYIDLWNHAQLKNIINNVEEINESRRSS